MRSRGVDVEPLVRCLRCDKGPKAHRVRVPHLTWAVYCKCGRQTDYFSGGKAFAVRAWNAANAANAPADRQEEAR